MVLGLHTSRELFILMIWTSFNSLASMAHTHAEKIYVALAVGGMVGGWGCAEGTPIFCFSTCLYIYVYIYIFFFYLFKCSATCIYTFPGDRISDRNLPVSCHLLTTCADGLSGSFQEGRNVFKKTVMVAILAQADQAPPSIPTATV